MKTSFRLIFVGGLIVSMAAYVLQVTLFTTMQERILYGAIGVVWYIILVCSYLFNVKAWYVLPAIAQSLAAALILGFVPHRLKLGSDFDFHILTMPALHFVATLLFVAARTHGKA